MASRIQPTRRIRRGRPPANWGAAHALTLDCIPLTQEAHPRSPLRCYRVRLWRRWHERHIPAWPKGGAR